MRYHKLHICNSSLNVQIPLWVMNNFFFFLQWTLSPQTQLWEKVWKIPRMQNLQVFDYLNFQIAFKWIHDWYIKHLCRFKRHYGNIFLLKYRKHKHAEITCLLRTTFRCIFFSLSVHVSIFYFDLTYKPWNVLLHHTLTKRRALYTKR